MSKISVKKSISFFPLNFKVITMRKLQKEHVSMIHLKSILHSKKVRIIIIQCISLAGNDSTFYDST